MKAFTVYRDQFVKNIYSLDKMDAYSDKQKIVKWVIFYISLNKNFLTEFLVDMKINKNHISTA